MMSGIALVLSLCVTNLWLKEAIGRTRPYDLFDGVRLLVERQPDPSFPSGHASASFAATVPMMKELPKALGFLVLILALLISVSRLYVGVHYLSDVLVGAVLGTVYALIACAFVNAADRKRSGRIREGRRFKAK